MSEPKVWGGAPKKKSGRPKWLVNLVTVVAFLLGVAMLVGGGLMVKDAMTPKAIDAPMPQTKIKKSVPHDVGPSDNVDVKNAVDRDGDDLASGDNNAGDDEFTDGSDLGDQNVKGSGSGYNANVAAMGRNSLFIPSQGVYAPIMGTSKFKPSRHAGQTTIALPRNARKVSWYSAGAPLVGGGEGTTLLAGHVAYNGVWGAFHNIAYMEPGNVAYTKDMNGAVQKWRVKEITWHKQVNFPQEYWSKEGNRQLVMVTCGGRFVGGHYIYNVFTIFEPVKG